VDCVQLPTLSGLKPSRERSQEDSDSNLLFSNSSFLKPAYAVQFKDDLVSERALAGPLLGGVPTDFRVGAVIAMAKATIRRQVIDSMVRQRLTEHAELTQFGDNALPLLGLALYLHYDNMEELGAAAMTDGSNDKKIDFCYIDPATKYAVVAQGYTARQWNRDSAPANKASDLITAAGWLFSGDPSHIPIKLRTIAEELRRAVKEEEITRIEFVYIHNCKESENVEKELRTAARVASDLIGNPSITVGHHEIGLTTLQNLCLSSESEILVRDVSTVSEENAIEESGKGWRSVMVTVTGDWLHELHAKHGPRLFSANYRDFLGVRNSVKNINNGIKTTVQEEPDKFWTYNNGITALTKRISKRRGKYSFEGISIINGAQTTGSIGECSKDDAAKVRVVCRFVQCHDKDTLHNIIRYNNTQNAFRSSDQRSTDSVQKRLAQELKKHKLDYVHRRSVTASARGCISAESVAPLLCAFHGDPQTAARRRNDIFDLDSIYQRVFPKACTGEHILLVHCFGQAIDAVKLGLKAREGQMKSTSLETKNYGVLKYSTSKLFFMTVMGTVAEEVLGEKLADPYTWRFRPEVIRPDLETLVFSCREAVEAVLPLVVASLAGTDAYDAVRDLSKVKPLAMKVSALISATGELMTRRFAPLKDKTVW
jgi:AIPR protein